MKEIEADGYITRNDDLTPSRKTCFNCNNYRYMLGKKRYVCIEGHAVDEPDWRQRYNVCDRWQKK